jgi:hypothetical protein
MIDFEDFKQSFKGEYSTFRIQQHLWTYYDYTLDPLDDVNPSREG